VYDAIGGAAGLAAAGDRLGLRDTVPEQLSGHTRTTAKDQTRLLQALTDVDSPLTEKSQKLALRLMSSVNADQNWGVSAAAMAGEQTALKNGWLARSTDDNRWIVNSIGRVSGEDTDVSLAVLSHGHADRQAGIEVVEQVAALTRSYLGW
jgi:hypothetical protein